MIERLYEFKIAAIVCFLHYTKAFDRVKWSLLRQIMDEMGVPEHVALLIKNMFSNILYMRIKKSSSFSEGKGVRHRYISSLNLFKI